MLDQTDKSILILLQENSKYTIKELSKRLNLTSTPIFERIKRLENQGYILSYSANIDRKNPWRMRLSKIHQVLLKLC